MLIELDNISEIKELLKLTEENLKVRLELTDRSKNSDKFYELKIVPYGKILFKLVASWGRIGKNGQTQMKVSGDRALCLSRLNHLIVSKSKKGYVRVY